VLHCVLIGAYNFQNNIIHFFCIDITNFWPLHLTEYNLYTRLSLRIYGIFSNELCMLKGLNWQLKINRYLVLEPSFQIYISTLYIGVQLIMDVCVSIHILKCVKYFLKRGPRMRRSMVVMTHVCKTHSRYNNVRNKMGHPRLPLYYI